MRIPRPLRHARPATSIRLRLTAVYGGLFLGIGALVLAITYGLFTRRLTTLPPRWITPPRPLRNALGIREARERVAEALALQRAEALETLLTQSALALAVGAVLALTCGWLMAGRILGRLEAAFEAQRRFNANVSHELRTPLTVQRAAVDVALADPSPSVESLHRMALRVRSAADRQERLIDGLLMLARSERGVERYEDVDLGEVVRESVEAVRPAADARGLRISVAPPAPGGRRPGLRGEPPSPGTRRPGLRGESPAPGGRRPGLRGDRILLERLVENLLDNAVRHNEPGGWIEAAVAAGPYGVTLRVANGGPVVPAELAATLFEPFRRSAPDRASGAEDGHGLGLSIVAAIAAAHHGRCTARPLPGGGLETVVELPAGYNVKRVAPYGSAVPNA